MNVFAQDGKLKAALHHEFLRFEDSFLRFANLVMLSISQLENRRAIYALYNAYSQFLHYPYEFYMGCIELDKRRRNPAEQPTRDEILDRELQKALTSKRAAILNGMASPDEID